MADPKHQGRDQSRPTAPPADRRGDVERLAAAVYAPLAATASVRGRTLDAVAREALEAARTFYRVCDEQAADTNKG